MKKLEQAVAKNKAEFLRIMVALEQTYQEAPLFLVVLYRRCKEGVKMPKNAAKYFQARRLTSAQGNPTSEAQLLVDVCLRKTLHNEFSLQRPAALSF